MATSYDVPVDHTSTPKPPVPRRPTSSKPGLKPSTHTPIPPESIETASSVAPPMPMRSAQTASMSGYIRGPPPSRPAPAPPPTEAESASPAVRAASVRTRPGPPRRSSVGARPVSMAPTRAPPARTALKVPARPESSTVSAPLQPGTKSKATGGLSKKARDVSARLHTRTTVSTAAKRKSTAMPSNPPPSKSSPQQAHGPTPSNPRQPSARAAAAASAGDADGPQAPTERASPSARPFVPPSPSTTPRTVAASSSSVPAIRKASPPVPASRPSATGGSLSLPSPPSFPTKSKPAPPSPPPSRFKSKKPASISTATVSKSSPPPVPSNKPSNGSTNTKSPVRPSRPSLPKRPSTSGEGSNARTSASTSTTPALLRPKRSSTAVGGDNSVNSQLPTTTITSNINLSTTTLPITLPRCAAPSVTVVSVHDDGADGDVAFPVGVSHVRDDTYGNLSDIEAEAAEAGDVFPSSLHRLSQQLYLDSDEDDDDLPELPTENLSPEEASNRKCYKIAHEMLTTEQSYVNSLKLIEDLFIKQLNAARASKKEIIPMDMQSLIFGNASQLYALHGGINSGSAHGVLAQLEEKLELDDATNKDGSGVGVVLRDVAPYMKAVYSAYTQTFDNATSTLSELNQKNAAWNAMLLTCHADPRCKKLTLSAFLLEPVQRIPRYKMLLEDYVKRRLPDHPDFGPAKEALATISKVAADVNSSITESENMLKMLEIQSNLPANALTPAVLPSRKLLKEGELQKMCRKGPQPRLVYLFSDCLLYCSTEHTKPRQVPLDTMRVEEIGSVGGVDHCISISQKKRSFILGCSSKRDKNQWYTALSEAAEQLSANKESFLEYKGQGSSSSQLNTLAQFGNANAGSKKAVIGATAPIWIPDSGVSMCQICTTGFTVLRRRHHCRACGKVVCDKCSPYKLKIAYDDSIGRVCVACFAEREGTTVDALLELPSGGGRQRASSFGSSSTIKRKKKMKQVLHAPAHGIISGKQDSDTIFAAYMEQKQRGLSLKSWKRSWYVLKRDFCLYQYRAPEDVVAQSAQPLPGFSVARLDKAAKEGGDREFVLKITHPSNKPIMLDCESDEHNATWHRHLSLAARATTEEDENAAAAAAATPLEEDEPLPTLPPTAPHSTFKSTRKVPTAPTEKVAGFVSPVELGTKIEVFDEKGASKETSLPLPVPQPRPAPRPRPNANSGGCGSVDLV